MTLKERFLEKGWVALPPDPALADWVAAARPVAEDLLASPEARAAWLRCGGTWFAGVNIFPNDAAGAVPGQEVPPLAGDWFRQALDVVDLDEVALDRAQISVCLPGYPQPSDEETEAAFRFRRDRDAAHVDGLLRFEGRRRRLGETHGFVLGLPLTAVPEEASPLVVWEGSHEMVRAAFRERLAGVPPAAWEDEDLTEAYVAVRQRAFAECRRVTVQVPPGSSYLVHRLALHGVAPWEEGGGTDPRIIAYFRPDPFPGALPAWWLERP